MAWMRQNSENEPELPNRSPAETTPHTPAASQRRETRVASPVVNIGKSIQIKGDLTGNEDLTIDGRIEGRIFLKGHTLTVGSNGHIEAEIQAKSVVVQGEVVGNIKSDDRVEIAASGSMQGDITASRVVLADGARFKGRVDMDQAGTGGLQTPTTATKKTETTPANVREMVTAK